MRSNHVMLHRAKTFFKSTKLEKTLNQRLLNYEGGLGGCKEVQIIIEDTLNDFITQ